MTCTVNDAAAGNFLSLGLSFSSNDKDLNKGLILFPSCSKGLHGSFSLTFLLNLLRKSS